MRAFFVIERGECKACRGMGVVLNPHPEPVLEGLHVRTYQEAVTPRRVVCPQCDGRGKIEREIPLAEALKEIRP